MPTSWRISFKSMECVLLPYGEEIYCNYCYLGTDLYWTMKRSTLESPRKLYGGILFTLVNESEKSYILTWISATNRMKESINIRKELNTLRDIDVGILRWQTLYTYIQLVMPLREEWKSSPIRVDLQAVTRVEVWWVFKTKLVIILLWTVWVHIVLLWSGFNEITKVIKTNNL